MVELAYVSTVVGLIASFLGILYSVKRLYINPMKQREAEQQEREQEREETFINLIIEIHGDLNEDGKEKVLEFMEKVFDRSQIAYILSYVNYKTRDEVT